MIPDLRKRIEDVMVPTQKAEVLPVNGRDIQRILGIKPGPKVGVVLEFLKDKKFEMERAGKEMTKNDAESLIIDTFMKA